MVKKIFSTSELFKYFLFLLFLLIATLDTQAQAGKATTGTGLYKDNIFWLNWDLDNNGSSGDAITDGTIRSFTSPSGVIYTATVSNLVGSPMSNSSYSYFGNNFPYGYGNIGGNNGAGNIIGINNGTNGQTASFRITIVANYPNGTAGNIEAFVIAGTETLSTNEYYQITTPSGVVRYMDKYIYMDNWSNMSTQLQVSSNGSVVRVANASSGDSKGDALLLAENVPYIDVAVKGGGGQHFAIGFIENVDFSDAPDSYGMAVHIVNSTTTGGALLDGNMILSTATNTLDSERGTIVDPLLLLGTLIDTEANYTPAAAGTVPNGDDITGLADEDAIESFSWPLCQATIKVKNETSNPAYLSLWIDADRNGVFNANEIATYTVPAGTNGNVMVSLSAIEGLKSGNNYYTRIRLSSTDNLPPDGFAIDGEVEDHWVNINPIITTPTPLIVCQGGTASFVGVTDTGATHGWTGPNGFVSTLQSPSISNVQPSDAGIYTLTLTYASGCVISSDVTLTVNSAPDIPTLGLVTQPNCITATGNVVLNSLPSGNWVIIATPATPGLGGLIGSGATTTVEGLIAGTTYQFKVENDLGCISALSAPLPINNIICANDDTMPVINGTTGGVTPSVFANDTLDGLPFLPADVTLTTAVPLPTGLTLNADGTITVDANTPVGSYDLEYTICEKLNSTNCDTATVTVVVSIIDATNDTPILINGTTGGVTPSVFANDTLDGLPFLPADVTLTTAVPLPTGLTLNADGTITVDANTAPGSYPITYSICQTANALICDTATVTVVVSTIDATNDTPVSINGTTGGVTPSVFANDTLDGLPFLPADVTLTTAVPLPTGLTLNADGTITVDANTASGSYPITYSICQTANALICDTATVTVVVSTIDATNDTPVLINGTTGGVTPSVFANDTLDGLPFSPADVTLTTAVPLPTGLTLNANGTITVDANTAPGSYPITYSICQTANALICDTATVTVVVSTIDATNDTPVSINGTTGGVTPSVFANDTLDGLPFLPADVTLTTAVPLPTGLTLNADGTITVDANTAPGSYPITYSICQTANALICDTATVTVVVSTIDATNDTPVSINGTTGGVTPSVFANDTLDGLPFLPADVTLTTAVPLPTGLTLNADGTITVDANTAPGSYPITYSICQTANALICDTATVTVVVSTIDATNDTPVSINGTTGGVTPSVFANDTLDGLPFLPADVTLTTAVPLPIGLTLNADGTITVDANTAPGSYPITYSICQTANALICDTATVTVVVSTIDATNDTPVSINGTTGGVTPSVFANDTLDGLPFLPADVTLTTAVPLPTGLTLNADGTITVDANTAPGSYPITYSICQTANALICDTATVTVVVSTIDATNDTPVSINGTTGGVTPSVFANDTLDGLPFLPADVTLTTAVPLPIGLTLNADGTITVDANTAPGSYPITYSICQTANALICDTATVTVVVSTIDATNDTPVSINGTTGGVTPSVFANDTLDGLPFSPADVTLTTAVPLPTGLTLNADGTITVDTNTAPGSYPITYSICQTANALICDTATVNVIVEVPSIEIIKKATFNDVNGDGFTQIGETITYNFSVVNTGTMQLTDVVVIDPMVTVTGGPLAVLNVGTKDDTTFNAIYVITQADIDAGSINNQALVTAFPVVGIPISNLSDSNDPTLPGKNDPTVTKLSQNPGLKLLKKGIYEDANNDGVVSVGDYINYAFRVINIGNVTIKDISVSDPMVTVLGGPISSLDPLAFDATTFTARYTLTQADIDLGAVYNLALVTGFDPAGLRIDNDSEDESPLTPGDIFYMPSCPKCTVTPLTQKSAIALIKRAAFNDENKNGNTEAGETITYSFIVTNTGNVKLTNITIKDPLPGIVITGGPISLAPGESDSTTFKGVYTIKQNDINAEKVSNQAFVTGENSLGIIVTDASDDTDNLGDNPTVLTLSGCTIKVFNAISANGDFKNERFYIKGIECYPDNTVEIYNRWGVLVFQRENYNNEERAFRGLSEGRTTVKKSEGLPDGTYYYILKYKDIDSNAHQEAGYLYLTK
ncbi:DUF7507 domain-containing protein [Flavobacterium sp.]|uniref:DUF7507 domain-containing protein n=1 Tax=Flavobacterium sp. TaxID=239 RepID=UPI003D0B52EA